MNLKDIRFRMEKLYTVYKEELIVRILNDSDISFSGKQIIRQYWREDNLEGLINRLSDSDFDKYNC
jgi:hypothetical protein